jgi:hypothetical protein
MLLPNNIPNKPHHFLHLATVCQIPPYYPLFPFSSRNIVPPLARLEVPAFLTKNASEGSLFVAEKLAI